MAPIGVSNLEMSRELGAPGRIGLICIICDQPLINATETSCGHKFCLYCISLWKKHNPSCPICKSEIGSLTKRSDIDSQIELFFSSSTPLVKEERKNHIKERNLSVGNLCGNIAEAEMKALLEVLKPSPPQITLSSPRRNFSVPFVDKNKELNSLLEDMSYLESQLESVYSKINETGQRLTAREDSVISRLCSAPIGGKETKILNQQQRPATAAIFRNEIKPSSSRTTTKLSREKLGGKESVDEIDALLELTDDVLRIDKFLKANSFDILTSEGDENIENELKKSEGTVLVSDEINNKDGLFEDAPNFKVHPEVQKYLDKCPLKIVPRVPKELKKVEEGEKIVANEGGDLVDKILLCRESLISMKNEPMAREETKNEPIMGEEIIQKIGREPLRPPPKVSQFKKRAQSAFTK